MRKLYLALLLCVTSSLARGNFVIPKAKLAGESVYVTIASSSARVAGIFEFESWMTHDEKVVYFPIFGLPTAEPLSVLSQSEFEFEIHGKTVGVAKPCDAPPGMKQSVAGLRIFWFAANLDQLVEYDEPNSEERMIVRFSYTQPLLHDCFYYLPIIPGYVEDEQAWRYQMLVRSARRTVQVTSKQNDAFPVADAVVVHLKDRSIVEVR
jgi:hypothetical protein